MYVDPDDPIEFGADIYSISREVPLQMDESQHEPGTKTIVGDYTIQGGQSGMEDIQEAVHHIFMHDNVGPCIARKLQHSSGPRHPKGHRHLQGRQIVLEQDEVSFGPSWRPPPL